MDLSIRTAREEDFAAIAVLRRSAFSLPLSLLMRFTMTRQALVAESTDGKIAGSVTFKLVNVAGRKIGVAEWAVVDPREQGKGIGKALLANLLAKFQAERCDDIVTTDVDGYNSASWNLGHAHRLTHWSLSSQVREFGWNFPKLWWKIPHVAPGAFLLRKSIERPAESSGLAALVFVTLLVGFFLLPLSRMRETLWDGFNRTKIQAPLAPSVLLAGAAVVLIFVAVRMAAQWLTARRLSLSLVFRPWDAGLLLATILAALFSAFIPAFAGSVYVREDKFNYSRARPKMGKIMLAAVTVSLALLIICTVWVEKSASAHTFGGLGRFAGISFGITDTLFFFAPFQAVPAGHIWLWRRSVWLAVTAVFLAVWLVLPILI